MIAPANTPPHRCATCHRIVEIAGEYCRICAEDFFNDDRNASTEAVEEQDDE